MYESLFSCPSEEDDWGGTGTEWKVMTKINCTNERLDKQKSERPYIYKGSTG